MLAIVGDRSTSVEIHHYNFDGGFHQTEGSDPRELSFKRVDQNTIEQDTQRYGTITVHRHIELSRDHKTMTLAASGTTGAGQRYANDIRVYEKNSGDHASARKTRVDPYARPGCFANSSPPDPLR
jgi:hypothetical protein